MAKDAFWLKHDSNARNDPKMIKLRRLKGLEGVGLFWCVVEALRESETYTLPLSNVEDLCYDLRCTQDVFDTLFNVGLLQKNNSIFWSESLNERMDEWEGIREKKSKAGKKSGEARRKKRQEKLDSQKEIEHRSNTAQTESKQSANKNEPCDGSDRVDRVDRVDKKEEELTFSTEFENQIFNSLQQNYIHFLESIKSDTVKKLVVNLSSDIYSGVNVCNEIQKSRHWMEANPTKKKTPRGLPKFLMGWIERAQNNNRGNNTSQKPKYQTQQEKNNAFFAEQERKFAMEDQNEQHGKDSNQDNAIILSRV